MIAITLAESTLVSDRAGRTEAQLFVDMLRETAENFYTPKAAALAKRVAAEIEAQITPKTPPKPEEPTGLGAVVEDADGDKWTSFAGLDVVTRWSHFTRFPQRWDDLSAVKVLSQGWSE